MSAAVAPTLRRNVRLKNVLLPSAELDRRTANTWYMFEGVDGAKYAGRVPPADFRYYGHLYEMDIQVVPYVPPAPQAVHLVPSKSRSSYTIIQVIEVRTLPLTCDFIELVLLLLARDTMDDGLPHLMPREQRTELARLRGYRWLQYFADRGALSELFMELSDAEKGSLENGAVTADRLRGTPNLLAARLLNASVLLRHPLLVLITLVVPFASGASDLAGAVLRAGYGHAAIDSMPPELVMGLLKILAFSPLDLFFHATAPLQLGPMPPRLLPRVRELPTAGGVTDDDARRLRAYASVIDLFRGGPCGGFVTLPTEEARIRAELNQGNLSELTIAGVLVELVVPPESPRHGDGTSAALGAAVERVVCERRVHDAEVAVASRLVNVWRDDEGARAVNLGASGDDSSLFGELMRHSMRRGVTPVVLPPGPWRTHLLARSSARWQVGAGFNVVLCASTIYATAALRAAHTKECAALLATCPRTTRAKPTLGAFAADCIFKFCPPSRNDFPTVLVIDDAPRVSVVHVARLLALYPSTKVVLLGGHPEEHAGQSVGPIFESVARFWGVPPFFRDTSTARLANPLVPTNIRTLYETKLEDLDVRPRAAGAAIAAGAWEWIPVSAGADFDATVEAAVAEAVARMEPVVVAGAAPRDHLDELAVRLNEARSGAQRPNTTNRPVWLRDQWFLLNTTRRVGNRHFHTGQYVQAVSYMCIETIAAAEGANQAPAVFSFASRPRVFEPRALILQGRESPYFCPGAEDVTYCALRLAAVGDEPEFLLPLCAFDPYEYKPVETLRPPLTRGLALPAAIVVVTTAATREDLCAAAECASVVRFVGPLDAVAAADTARGRGRAPNAVRSLLFRRLQAAETSVDAADAE